MENILLIIPGIPYPPTDGHKLKIYNLILILKKHFKLNIIILSTKNLNYQETKFLNEHCEDYKFFKLKKLEILYNLLISVFTPMPFQVAFYKNNECERYLIKHKRDYKYVFFNLIRSFHYSKYFQTDKIILDMVDLISVNYKSSMRFIKPLFKKILYSIEANRLYNYEKFAIDVSHFTLLVNHNERFVHESFHKIEIIPNGVKENLFTYSSFSNLYKNTLVFFGSLYYQPNIDALLWFDRFVLDYLDPNIQVLIIGSRPTKKLIDIQYRRSNVKFTGFLEDPYLIINSSFGVISPVLSGAGIQNKVLEAMALGKIVFLNSFSAAPIKGAYNHEHFIIEDDPVLYAKNINTVFRNQKKYFSIGENARNLIKSEYSWDIYESKLINIINKYKKYE